MMTLLTKEDADSLRNAQLQLHDLVSRVYNIQVSPIELVRIVISDKSLYHLRDICLARLRNEEVQKLFPDLLGLVVLAGGGPSWAEEQIIGKLENSWIKQQLEESSQNILPRSVDVRDYAAIYRLAKRVDVTFAKNLIRPGLESSDYDIREFVSSVVLT
jgi:hypothetical protein